MTLLPIVARELRVSSRRRATYWTRFSAGLLAIIVSAFVWFSLFRNSSKDTGIALFVSLSIIAYIYSLLAGTYATADSVSEEKREGTLGLLFLTDLRSYDIVLGKLAASSLTSVYGLLAIFPIMGVPLLLGGVAPAEFWRVVIVCANNLFFSLTVGLLCSAICKDERKAIGLTIGFIILLTGGWPALIAWIASEIRSNHPLYDLFHHHPEPLLVLSPGFACAFAFDANYKRTLAGTVAGAPVSWFHISVGITHLLSWGALLLTALVLPRIWRDKAASKATLRRRETWKQWTLGNDDVRTAFRRRLLGINPFYWLASRERFKVAFVWWILLAAAALWFLGMVRNPRDWLNEGVYICTALIVHTLFKCWIAMEAPKRVGIDRRSGALELLLSTPLRVSDILRGQWLALLRQFGGATVLVCAVDLLFLGLGLKHNYSASDRDMWIGVWLAGMFIFVFDLITIPPLAMWLSLTGRKASRASTTSLVLVCCLPWLAFGGVTAVIAVLAEFFHFRASSLDSGWSLLGMWFAICVVTNLFLVAWSLGSLRSKFRLVATERLESRTAFFRRIFGRKATETQK